jgi:hypothetical protein
MEVHVKKREDRRDRSWRAARRRQRIHLRKIHPDGVVDCACERSVWYFETTPLEPCDCRRRKRGAPKISLGPCYGSGSLRPAVRARIETRRLCRRWLHQDYDL